MDQIKIGAFIASERKAKNMTQIEFAEKLGVSNKSISRWETGRNMPDMSMINDICELLDISITEFFSGERIAPQEMVYKAEEKMVKTIDYSEKRINKKHKEMLFVIVILILSILFNISSSVISLLDNTEEEGYVPYYSVSEDYQTIKFRMFDVEKEYKKIEVENAGSSGDGQYGEGSYMGVVKVETDSKVEEFLRDDHMFLVYEDENTSILRLDTDYEEDYFYCYNK